MRDDRQDLPLGKPVGHRRGRAGPHPEPLGLLRQVFVERAVAGVEVDRHLVHGMDRSDTEDVVNVSMRQPDVGQAPPLLPKLCQEPVGLFARVHHHRRATARVGQEPTVLVEAPVGDPNDDQLTH